MFDRGWKEMETKTGLDIRGAGNVAVASFQHSCISDVEEIRNASTQLKDYIEQNRPNKVIFDFAGVKFFSSQVLGLLLEARAHLQPGEEKVAVSALSPQLQRVFKITNLDKIFTFYGDTDAALSQLAPTPG
jgi:anti-sigma B factor antagonist